MKDKAKKTKSKEKNKPAKQKAAPPQQGFGIQHQMMPELKAGTYSDGHALDEVQYLEAKLILKGDRFTSVQSFHEFGALVARAAKASGVKFSTKKFTKARPQIREVLFLDTEDFKLYNNAFILRRRITYKDGFPVGDPEIVFKYRHPDLQKAAEMDVRANIPGNYRIKFKVEALPLKDQIGGIRLLYSHNVQFGMSQQHSGDITSSAMKMLGEIFPALHKLRTKKNVKVELVNQTAVEEVLLDIGMLNFGEGVKGKANMSVWRTRGDQRQLVGEFAFQCKFLRREERHHEAMRRGEQFFCTLQQIAQDWIALGTTKTGAVYRLKGNPPQSHE